VVDLLHEDVNMVKEKPFIEVGEDEGRTDSEIAEEFWHCHLKRNRSIFVDVMTGLLKSSITCQTCGWLSVKFDPMTSV